MSSIMSIGASAMQAAASRFETAATRVVRASAGMPGADDAREVDLPTAMVTMSLASYDFKAATRVAMIGRDIVQSALDMVA